MTQTPRKAVPMTLPSKTEHELEELLRRVEAHDDDGDAAYIELCAEAAAALPALLAAARREARLAAATERVLRVAFTDDGRFLTQNSVPMDSTPGVRRAIAEARSVLAEDDQPTPEATDEPSA